MSRDTSADLTGSIILTAVPHRAMKSDVYDGYYIPAGSTIIGNVW